jgi:hypothetical protein
MSMPNLSHDRLARVIDAAVHRPVKHPAAAPASLGAVAQ